MARKASNRHVGIVICVLLFVLCGLVYYTLYIRRKFLVRLNYRQLFEINRLMLGQVEMKREKEELIQLIPELIRTPLGEILSVRKIALLFLDSGSRKVNFSVSPIMVDGSEEKELQKALLDYLDRYNDVKAEHTLLRPEGYVCFPLGSGKEEPGFGVMAFSSRDGFDDKEGELQYLRVVADFVSIILQNSIIRPSEQEEENDILLDETRRIQHENARLHVQNQILDNCLSAIKHETVYYPGRIQQLLQQCDVQDGTEAKDSSSDREKEKLMGDVVELVTYYRSIFTLLGGCAAQQLENTMFRRTTFDVARLIEEETKTYFKQRIKKIRSREELPTFTCSCPEGLFAVGDSMEISYLIECLIDESLSVISGGELWLEVNVADDFVRFCYTDTRRNLSTEELDTLFSPDFLCRQGRMILQGGFFPETPSGGMEFLICKQIIRDHDEHLGHPGCRINAEQNFYPNCGKGTNTAERNGFKIWFTIPLKSK